MYFNTLIKNYGTHLLNTLIAAIVVCVICCIIYFVFRKWFEGARLRRKLKHRVSYIGVLFFLLILIRIWVEGFTHIFTMLSLIAAGIVVTNKENIMNIAGWLIINWRGVFSEGDYVQIQNAIGYVESIKLLTFKLIETDMMGNTTGTGKSIKVPNGLIITNPIYIFHSENSLMLYKLERHLPANSTSLAEVKKAQEIILDIIHTKYDADHSYTHHTIKKNNKHLSRHILLEPTVNLKLITDKPDLVLMSISYYCYPKDRAEIENAFVTRKIAELHSNDETK